MVSFVNVSRDDVDQFGDAGDAQPPQLAFRQFAEEQLNQIWPGGRGRREDEAFRRSESRKLAFLPLFQDLMNPSPDQGWGQLERTGLSGRIRADAVLCLALIHHLVLGRNVPLEEAIAWLVGLAPSGVIEFVPKTDPMARTLLTLKPDHAPDYNEDAFLSLLGARSRIVRKESVTNTGRLLVSFRTS